MRVTSAPGSDSTGDSGGDTSPLASLSPSPSSNVYNQVIRASDVWNLAGKFQGKGVTVAVVDSGVYKTKDLDKRVRANVNFNKEFHDSADRYGYGTFVAGIVAGNGSQSGQKYMGVAPRADVLNVRVSNDQGMSTESDVIGALQWVNDNRIDKTYFRMSGTSVSAPMVSGAVVLLLQDEPNLTPDQVKYRLKATANKTWAGYTSTKGGAGYLDIYAAIHGTTTQAANTSIQASSSNPSRQASSARRARSSNVLGCGNLFGGVHAFVLGSDGDAVLLTAVAIYGSHIENAVSPGQIAR